MNGKGTKTVSVLPLISHYVDHRQTESTHDVIHNTRNRCTEPGRGQTDTRRRQHCDKGR